MNSAVMEHPAIEVAARSVRDFDAGLTPVAAVLAHPGLLAVVLDSIDKRFTVFVEHREDGWVAPGLVCGSPLRPKPRESSTSHTQPLANRKTNLFTPCDAVDGVGWFAVTGLAARDAVSVSVISELGEHVAPIGEDGLAFAVVRARSVKEPNVYVHTRDGRRVSASLRQAG